MRDASRRILLDVSDPYPELGPIADSVLDLLYSLGCVPHDHPDVHYPRVPQCFDTVEEHWLVGQRNQVLVARMGDGSEPSSRSARENQALHDSSGVMQST